MLLSSLFYSAQIVTENASIVSPEAPILRESRLASQFIFGSSKHGKSPAVLVDALN